MNALYFLLTRRLKNRLLTLARSPRHLCVGLSAAALLFLSLLTGNIFAGSADHFRSREELCAAVTILYAVIFALTSYNGFLKGAVLFSSADTRFIFVSPITKSKAMIYGLVRQLGVSASVGLSILFQYSWIHSVYGVGFADLLLILAGLALAVFLGQMTAMLIFTHTSSDKAKKRCCKFIVTAFTLFPPVAVCIRGMLLKSYSAETFLSLINDINGLFLVSGWIRSAVIGMLFGEASALSAVAVAAYAGVIFTILVRSKHEYYEDVLTAAEIEYVAGTVRREGKFNELSPDKIRRGRTGLKHGHGADALYYRQKLESRRAGVFALDAMTLIFLGINLFAAIMLRRVGMAAVFIFSTYMQIFTAALGRWARELVLPYIYLISEPPFKKLIHCLRQPFKRICIEALLLCTTIAFIFGLTPHAAAAVIITRISYGCLFTSGCVMTERFFHGITIRIAGLIIYFIFMIVLSLPGLIAGAIAALSHYPEMPSAFGVLIPISAANLAVSAFALFISRNMLEYAEFNS